MDENENAVPDLNCSYCKKEISQSRCSQCKKANYCSRNCQKSDWSKHKLFCSMSDEPATATGTTKPSCGLCGFTGSRQVAIIKTECCNNWICDDQPNYELQSYKLNSCMRNHDRYSKCSLHHKDQHEGLFRECEICKKSAKIEMKQACPDKRHWYEFVNKHFLFENVTEKEKASNRLLKKDGTKALIVHVPLSSILPNQSLNETNGVDLDKGVLTCDLVLAAKMGLNRNRKPC
jgi:hypothetical protein